MTRIVSVWDIDGTIANHDHRAQLLKKRCAACLHEPMPVGHHASCPVCGGTSSRTTKESWDAFLDPDIMYQDTPIEDGLKVLDKLRSLGSEIHFITGRSRSDVGEVTEEWLKFRVGRIKETEHLLMRESVNEGEPASVYKGRAILKLKEMIGSDGVFYFFEDDPHVFSVYSEHGIVIQCPEGLKYFMPEGSKNVEPRYTI